MLYGHLPAEHSTPKAKAKATANRHRKRRKQRHQHIHIVHTRLKRSQRSCRPTNSKKKTKTIRGKMSANFNPYVQGWRVGNGSSNRGLGESPSIFGALPMTSGSNAQAAAAAAQGGHGQGSDPNATVFHIADFRPNVLNASVVDARGRQCYKIVTDMPQQPQRTVYYDAHRRTVAIVDWAGSRPSVEMPGLLPRQALRSWLQTGPDRAYVHSSHQTLSFLNLIPTSVFLSFGVMSRSRLMEIRGIPHIWVPNGEFICVRFRFSSHHLCLVHFGLTHNDIYCRMQLYYANHSNSQRLARICLTRDAVRIELSQHAMEARLLEVCILGASIFLSGFKID